MISKLCTSDYGGGGSGGGCGKMVSVLAFYSDNLSSNFVEDYVFKLSEKNENNQKEASEGYLYCLLGRSNGIVVVALRHDCKVVSSNPDTTWRKDES